ncbi:helix-turn-helix domain-containing protein [Kitasatospora sp. NPDC091335]|uniref:helix-turn-helix domain-containing protein n=1 Tax=Kitasatospora sp. NPDC091335 TaxID=3364085 RepID=UPI00381D9E10
MDWRTAAGAAARAGDFGRVVELSRLAQQMTQLQLGDLVGLSQSAVSRMERRGPGGTYDMSLLGRVAVHLGIPASLVGLADLPAGASVERRDFLGVAAVAAAAAVTPAVAAPSAQPDAGQAAALRLGTASYRRLDGSASSRDLADVVRGHIRLIQQLSTAGGDRARLAATGSEAASFAGWLAWDMGDHGSARSWYGQAVKAARTARDGLLLAYQLGSLAQFEGHTGNGNQALTHTRKARAALGINAPAIADAWLAATEALAYAACGDRDRTDQALTRSRALTLRLGEETPPWPWVFTFDERKVQSARVACGARLGVPEWVLSVGTEALATGHAKGRALLMMDLAAGHLAAGRIDGAFAIASRALDIGITYRSGRIVERARALRRTLTTTAPPRVVQEFDERLHDVYL